MRVRRDRPDGDAARGERPLRQAIARLTATDLDELQAAVRAGAWARALRPLAAVRAIPSAARGEERRYGT
jgi:hypothetical protein